MGFSRSSNSRNRCLHLRVKYTRLKENVENYYLKATESCAALPKGIARKPMAVQVV